MNPAPLPNRMRVPHLIAEIYAIKHRYVDQISEAEFQAMREKQSEKSIKYLHNNEQFATFGVMWERLRRHALESGKWYEPATLHTVMKSAGRPRIAKEETIMLSVRVGISVKKALVKNAAQWGRDVSVTVRNLINSDIKNQPTLDFAGVSVTPEKTAVISVKLEKTLHESVLKRIHALNCTLGAYITILVRDATTPLKPSIDAALSLPSLERRATTHEDTFQKAGLKVYGNIGGLVRDEGMDPSKVLNSEYYIIGPDSKIPDDVRKQIAKKLSSSKK